MVVIRPDRENFREVVGALDLMTTMEAAAFVKPQLVQNEAQAQEIADRLNSLIDWFIDTDKTPYMMLEFGTALQVIALDKLAKSMARAAVSTEVKKMLRSKVESGELEESALETIHKGDALHHSIIMMQIVDTTLQTAVSEIGGSLSEEKYSLFLQSMADPIPLIVKVASQSDVVIDDKAISNLGKMIDERTRECKTCKKDCPDAGNKFDPMVS